MKNKIIITTLFIVFSMCIQAQDKYQFMMIRYTLLKAHINISIDGEQCLKEDVDVSGIDKGCANPLLKKVKEYQDKGWEVMNFTNNS